MAGKYEGTHNDRWLKILIALIITLFVAGFGYLEKTKVSKEVYEVHNKYQNKQLNEIKGSLRRIEDRLGTVPEGK